MYKCLSPGAINVNVNSVQEAIEAAVIGGFGGVEISPFEIADLIDKEGASAVRAMFDAKGIQPAGFGLTVEWRKDEETWKQGLAQLPRAAKAAGAIGAGRAFTWVLSCSDTYPLEENIAFHIERFTPIAQILADNGCDLGLEFLGPKTLRNMLPHPFLYKMFDMLDLGARIGSNVGILLDCWHWHTSEGTIAELEKLRPEQVTYVHVNDAPMGVAMDDYVDNMRGLPGETGVIDIAGFLKTLDSIGYTGPVTPEPFKNELKDLPNNTARLQVVGDAMNKIFRQAGLE
ncbi:hypothetical protein LBMAG21_04710 [Armatimonadota bacterium]|nr:hypothetical protein LBMAG21_04710 [Armatimonadota bacterium]